MNFILRKIKLYLLGGINKVKNVFRNWFGNKTLNNDVNLNCKYTGCVVKKNNLYIFNLAVFSDKSFEFKYVLNNVFSDSEMKLLKADIFKIVNNDLFIIVTTVFSQNKDNALVTFSIPNIRNLKQKDLEDEFNTIKEEIMYKCEDYQTYHLLALSFKIYIKK